MAVRQPLQYSLSQEYNARLCKQMAHSLVMQTGLVILFPEYSGNVPPMRDCGKGPAGFFVNPSLYDGKE
jgi:hypothetical protein